MYCADEEEKELPHPFLLPKYPMDVEIALQQGKLLATTYQKFISGTARAILSYKRHPTPDERNRVASEIVGKYPFLKSPGNKPEMGVSQAIRSWFKEFNRVRPQSQPVMQEDLQPKAKKTKVSSKMPVSTVKKHEMHGEDSTSYSRNTALLQTQYLKKDPAPAIIKSLMELTVWRRRDDIEKSSDNVTATLMQYPFLGDKEFFLYEFGLIAKPSSKDVWTEWGPRILHLADQEKKVMEQLQECEDEGIKALKALVLMLTNRKTKKAEIVGRLCLNVPDAVPIEEAACLPDEDTPCVLIKESGQIFLAVDKVPIMEVDASEAPLALLASHYIFNICYPVGLESVYTFFEYIYMDRKPVKQGVVFNRFFSAVHA